MVYGQNTAVIKSLLKGRGLLKSNSKKSKSKKEISMKTITNISCSHVEDDNEFTITIPPRVSFDNKTAKPNKPQSSSVLTKPISSNFIKPIKKPVDNIATLNPSNKSFVTHSKPSESSMYKSKDVDYKQSKVKSSKQLKCEINDDDFMIVIPHRSDNSSSYDHHTFKHSAISSNESPVSYQSEEQEDDDDDFMIVIPHKHENKLVNTSSKYCFLADDEIYSHKIDKSALLSDDSSMEEDDDEDNEFIIRVPSYSKFQNKRNIFV